MLRGKHSGGSVRCAFDRELEVGRNEDANVAMQVGSLSRRCSRAATGLNKINFLLPVEARSLGRSMRLQRWISISVEKTEKRRLYSLHSADRRGVKCPVLRETFDRARRGR